MRVKGKHYRTICMKGTSVFMIDQNLLPFKFKIHKCDDHLQTCNAISNMTVRGAGAIGAASAFAMAQSFSDIDFSDSFKEIEKAMKRIESTRPTARNLFYATQRVFDAAVESADPLQTAVSTANRIADEDVAACQSIGIYGEELLHNATNVLTHCNAGWLAFVDYGSALSPIYTANKRGKNIFVYVDETSPRLQGARLTAWELFHENIPHAIIPDNAAAYYMSKGKIDLVICGADRIARNGDVANKIGTLEKAIIAKEFRIPFYIAAPISTVDFSCSDGTKIIIENRSEKEVLFQSGLDEHGEINKIRVCSPGSSAFNPAFDVTPAHYISGIITEKGIITADENGINSLLDS